MFLVFEMHGTLKMLSLIKIIQMFSWPISGRSSKSILKKKNIFDYATICFLFKQSLKQRSIQFHSGIIEKYSNHFISSSRVYKVFVGVPDCWDFAPLFYFSQAIGFYKT